MCHEAESEIMDFIERLDFPYPEVFDLAGENLEDPRNLDALEYTYKSLCEEFADEIAKYGPLGDNRPSWQESKLNELQKIIDRYDPEMYMSPYEMYGVSPADFVSL